MAQSMYERYGGFAAVRKVVSSFYDKVLESDQVAGYFAHVNVRRLIDHQAKFIAFVMGGPASYTDEQLRRAHAAHKITRADFEEVAALLEETLEDFEFEPQDIDYIMREVARRAPQIISA